MTVRRRRPAVTIAGKAVVAAIIAVVWLSASAADKKLVHVVTILKEMPPAADSIGDRCTSDTIISTVITNASDTTINSIVASMLGTTAIEAEIVRNITDTVFVDKAGAARVKPAAYTSADTLSRATATSLPAGSKTPAAATSPVPAHEVKGSFAWGAETGGSIDMSSNDMSSIDISAYFGYKRGGIKFIGIGAAMDIMVSNSARSFPIYLGFKTNFRRRQSLVFMDLRIGFAENYLPNDYQQAGAYSFLGLGINLARGRKFSSYTLIGYTYKGFQDIETSAGEIIKLGDLHMASLRLGITF